MSVREHVLITGANGFIGSHTLKTLSAKKDYRACGLVRKTSNLFRLHSGDYELFRGSITDTLDEIMSGFDAVVHTAGMASDWGPYGAFHSINVDGTINVARSALRCGVKKFVYLSSTVVYGFGGHVHTDENTPLNPFPNSYCETKTIAEEKLLELKDDINIVVLRPSNVFGPHDLSFTYRLLKSLDRGLIGFPRGGRSLTSPCFVGNLVHAIERALTMRIDSGQAFNISDGADIPWRTFLRMCAEKMNKKSPLLPVPSAPLYMLSVLLEKCYTLAKSRTPPLITPYRIAISSRNYSFSVEKARAVFGYSPRFSTSEGIKESVAWYRNFDERVLHSHTERSSPDFSQT
jgi:nucleoside-diphosphate-sugar epimerase